MSPTDRFNKRADKANMAFYEARGDDGRGVSCVRTIITYLRLGDIEKAKAVCLNESDKISSYPDIKELLEKELV